MSNQNKPKLVRFTDGPEAIIYKFCERDVPYDCIDVVHGGGAEGQSDNHEVILHDRFQVAEGRGTSEEFNELSMSNKEQPTSETALLRH